MKILRAVLLVSAISLVPALHIAAQAPSAADSPKAEAPKMPASLPFSPGLALDGRIYVSGHLGLDPATNKPPADVSEEARQVLRSIQTTLAQGGLTMDDLVYVEIYCTDLSLYSAFNKEYVSFFHKPYPARDFIGVKDLLFGAHFEVMGIAVKDAAANKKPLSQTK